MTDQTPDFIPGIVSYIKTRVSKVPDVGIICGSGLSGLAAEIKDPFVIKYEEIKGFPESTVAGHVGEMVFGELGGKYVVALKGRFHFYEGYPPAQVVISVRVLAALGIRLLVVTNAAGGVNPGYSVGDVMIIKDQIALPALAGHHPLVGRNDERFGPRFPAVSPALEPELQDTVEAVAKRTEVKLNIHRGVYFGVSGPSYETPHEIQLIRTLGGDAVGMSTVFEILTAAHSGVRVLGLSLITNKCKIPGDDTPAPTHEEVLAATKVSESQIQLLVSEFVAQVDVSNLPRSKAYEFFSNELRGELRNTREKPKNHAVLAVENGLQRNTRGQLATFLGLTAAALAAAAVLFKASANRK